MYKLFVVFLLSILTHNSIADDVDIPAFNSSPIKYANAIWIRNSTGGKVSVKDELLVGDFKNDKMKFWIFVYGPNYHQCTLSGEAEKLSESTYQFKENKCTLLIKFGKNSASLSDDGNTCHENHCGNNAYFDKAEFFKPKN